MLKDEVMGVIDVKHRVLIVVYYGLLCLVFNKNTFQKMDCSVHRQKGGRHLLNWVWWQ